MDNQQVSIPECWKQYKDTLYEISNHGNIRFIKTKKPKRSPIQATGYREFQYKRGGKRLSVKLHRAVAELFLDPPSQELVDKCSKEHWGKVLVKHKDNDKLNNNVLNLEWCDLLSNTQQAWADGLIKGQAGSANGRATLTDDVVHAMCQDFENGMTPSEAVRKYNVSRQQATKIRAGFAWKHISCNYHIVVNKRNKTSTTSCEA